MLLLTTVLLGFLYRVVQCDYSCLCIQGSETLIFATDNITYIGTGQIGDCYLIIQHKDGDNGVAFAYKHQIGYIRKDSNVQMVTCAGDPYKGDILTTQATSMQPTTITQATTMKPTTTTQATTMQQTTTTKATTTQSTTTEKPTTTQPETTEKDTTIQPTTKSTSTIQPTTVRSTIQPATTLSHVTLVNQGVCPQIVQEHARDDNNIVATHGHTCYEVMTHRQTTWQAAETDCKSRGGHLLSIASTDEQDFISELLTKNSFHYNLIIGLD